MDYTSLGCGLSVVLNVVLIIIIIRHLSSMKEGFERGPDSLFDDMAVSITGPTSHVPRSDNVFDNALPVSVISSKKEDSVFGACIWGNQVTHGRWLFFKEFEVEEELFVEIHLMAEGEAVAYLDGIIVTEIQGSYVKAAGTLHPGKHVFSVYCQQNKNKGCLMSTIVSNEGKTIVSTDRSWKCKKIKI